MGKFDHVLLCSDWDGTLSLRGTVSAGNIEAIRYFQAEGGKFTLASGRFAGHFKQFESLICPNTLIVCAGGSCIMDRDGKIHYEKFCNKRMGEYARLLMRKESPYEEVQITVRDHDPFVFNKETVLSSEAEKIFAMDTIYKAIFLTPFDTESANRALEYTKNLPFDGYMPMRSFPFSIELIPADAGKGRAIRWLANKIGSRLLVAVGDYENDCDMLAAADYGYAVSGGSVLARKSANRFAATFARDAVASVIEELDAEIRG